MPADGNDGNEEEEVEVDVDVEEEAQDEESPLATANEDTLRQNVELEDIDRDEDEVENIADDGINASCLTDVWSRGKALVEKDNVRKQRTGKASRQLRKKSRFNALRMFINRLNEGSSTCEMKKEVLMDHQSEVSRRFERLSKFSSFGDLYN